MVSARVTGMAARYRACAGTRGFRRNLMWEPLAPDEGQPGSRVRAHVAEFEETSVGAGAWSQ
jgi:hypothetical protein